MIYNEHLATFRAWPAKIYEPKRRDVYEMAEDFRADLDAMKLPDHEHSTTLLRISLGTGHRRESNGWIEIGGPIRNRWDSDGQFGLGIPIPQNYAVVAIQHLGSTFGVSAERLGDELRVTWNGAFIIQERVRLIVWVTSKKQPNIVILVCPGSWHTFWV